MANKNIAKISLAELAKRVPKNQELEFQNFKAKHVGYQARVNKLPEKLPAIDFDFYRINVRPEVKTLVDEFQQKYKALCEKYDAREKQDFSKYYVELEKVRKETKADIEKFKAESNERIKELEAEYENIECLKPYNEMTLEEYCDLLPDKKMYTFEGHPSFWPHTPDEQSLEPAVKGHGHDDHGDGGDHKNPPKDGTNGNAAGGAPAAPSAPPAACAEGEESKAAKADSKGDTKSANAIDISKQNSATSVQNKDVKEPNLPQKCSVEAKDNSAKVKADEEMNLELFSALLDDKDRKAATVEK